MKDAMGKDFNYGNRKGKLIGVFNDFHFESMHQKIVPLILMVPRNANFFGRISVKVGGNNIPVCYYHTLKKPGKNSYPIRLLNIHSLMRILKSFINQNKSREPFLRCLPVLLFSLPALVCLVYLLLQLHNE